MSNIQVNNRKVLSDESYRLEEITFTSPDLDGRTLSKKNEVYFRPDAVAVLLADRQRSEFIMTRQLRLPVFLNPKGDDKGYLLEVCAGLLEEAETPEAAAIREVKEETGYTITETLGVGAVYTSAGGITEYLHLFISEVTEEDRQDHWGGVEGEGEAIQLVRLSFAEAGKMLFEWKINDAKTMLLLQQYFNLQSMKPIGS